VQITAIPAGMGNIERAHSALNGAYNALALGRAAGRATAPAIIDARDWLAEVHEQLTPLAGHDGPDDAAAAARAILPRLDRMRALLEGLGATDDAAHVDALLQEIGVAMDHAEAALAAVGWE
jgi:hypothetical protein